MGGNQKAGFYLYDSGTKDNRVIIMNVKLQTGEAKSLCFSLKSIIKNKYSRRPHIRRPRKFENVVVTNNGHLRELALVSEHTLKSILTVKLSPGLVSGLNCLYN